MFDCHISLNDIDNSDFIYLLEVYKYKLEHTETDNTSSYSNSENNNNSETVFTRGIPED